MDFRALIRQGLKSFHSQTSPNHLYLEQAAVCGLLLATLVMDDVRQSLIYSILFLITAVGGLSQAVDFEYIPPEKQTQLESEFNQAKKSFTSKDVADKDWKCDMYGMRSRLRVERDVHLYKFAASKTDELSNEGAQILDSYVIKGDEIIGKNDKVEDAVRMTSKGQIIARLSSLHPERRVAAYSVCTAQ